MKPADSENRNGKRFSAFFLIQLKLFIFQILYFIYSFVDFEAMFFDHLPLHLLLWRRCRRCFIYYQFRTEIMLYTRSALCVLQ